MEKRRGEKLEGIQVSLITKNKGLHARFFEGLKPEDVATVWIRWIGKKSGEQKPILTVNLDEEDKNVPIP